MNRRNAIMALPFLAAIPWLSKSGDGDGKVDALDRKKKVNEALKQCADIRQQVMDAVTAELQRRGVTYIRTWSIRPEIIWVDWNECPGHFRNFSAPVHETEFELPASAIVDRIWPESVKRGSEPEYKVHVHADEATLDELRLAIEHRIEIDPGYTYEQLARDANATIERFKKTVRVEIA